MTDQIEGYRAQAARLRGQRDTARAEVTRLTAEVERLRGLGARAAALAAEMASAADAECMPTMDEWREITELVAALALPTNAPEGTDG